MTLKEQMKAEKNSASNIVNSISYKSQMDNSYEKLDPRNGLRNAENFVKKFYLDSLDRFKVTNLSRSILEEENIKKIVMDVENENSLKVVPTIIENTVSTEVETA